jgi:hypothetical protein
VQFIRSNDKIARYLMTMSEEISDEIKEARFIIIQSLNGKEITLDIVIKYLAILSLERMNCTLVL